jgi:parvulin-like peptidyl-prolyl isomerase
MKIPCFLLLVCLGAASCAGGKIAGATGGAQTPAPPSASPVPAAGAPPKAAPAIPDLPDPTVIAEFQDGSKFTMGDLKRLYPALQPQLQNAIRQDPVEFFHEYATMLAYEKIALEKKLDEQSPYKERLFWDRLFDLYLATLQDVFATSTVDSNEIVNYYGKNKESFKQVKVKAIYITFADAPSAEDKSLLTEAQAKAKADKLVAQAKGGADFVKLVKENSEDDPSKAKDGDFGTFSTTDPLPDAIRQAVFALQMGEVTDAVRQPHGFYIFKAEIVTIRDLSEVRDQIFRVLKQQHAADWVKRVDAEVKVSFPNPAFPPKGAPSKPAK